MKYQIQLLGTPWNVNELIQIIQAFYEECSDRQVGFDGVHAFQ